MFCPKCGTNNQEGAAFCANCGNPFAQQQQQPVAPGAYPVAGGQPQGGIPGGVAGIGNQVQDGIGGIAGQIQNGVGGAVAKAGGSNTKLIIMAVAAIAVVVALVMLVRAFACSAGAVNLNDVVLKDPKDVAGMVDRYEEVKIQGTKFIVSSKDYADDMKDISLSDADDDKDDAAKVRKHDGEWALHMLDKKYSAVTKDDLKDGDDPAYVVVVTVAVDDDMTCDKMNKILSKWVRCDDVIMARGKTSIEGYFSGDGVLGYVSAYRGTDEAKDIWQVSITVVDEDVDDSVVENMKYAKKNWEDNKDYKEVYTKK